MAFRLAFDFLPIHRNLPSSNEHEASAAMVSPRHTSQAHSKHLLQEALGFTGASLNLYMLVKYTPKVKHN